MWSNGTFSMACHKEIIAKEIVDLFTHTYYKLHGVLKVIAPDMDPRFVFKFWQSFMSKGNTKLNMTTARHPQTNELVNETMRILLRCYTTKSGFDWVSQLPIVEFYYNCSANEA